MTAVALVMARLSKAPSLVCEASEGSVPAVDTDALKRVGNRDWQGVGHARISVP